MVDKVEDLNDIREELLEEERQSTSRQSQVSGFKISKLAADRRVSKPTGSAECTIASGRQRRNDTIAALSATHGGSEGNLKPVTIGMLETMEKKCKEEDLVNGLKKCVKLKKKVFPRVYKQELRSFEKANLNMLRSIAVYYSKGVIGKEKYKSVYKATSYMQVAGKKGAVRIKVADCPTPGLVPYHRLMAYIKSIDVGKLFSVDEVFCGDLEEQEKVNGCFRDLEDLLVKLAEFYMNDSQHNLITFNSEPNTFHVALGGDAAPFGKDDSACSWLVSFLNIGQGVSSSNENFLLFGANCTPIKRFLSRLITDIRKIQGKSYPIACKGKAIDVKFVFAELPNDMKMLAFLGGELSNSAKYFSSFADVDKNSVGELNGTFGRESTDTWKPWVYKRRIEVVKAVETFKEKVEMKNVKESTKRSNITSFIATQKSRQEFVPLVAELIDRAHVEPLHLKNNLCALAHRHLLNLAVSKLTSSSISCFSQVPKDTPFFQFIEALRSKCKLKRLAKKVISWYNENGMNRKEFDYRFTGRDSRMFLHNFMFLIDVLEKSIKGRETEAIHCHAYLCLCLRNAVSLFSRFDITDDQVEELKDYCTSFHRGYNLYFSANTTVWTLGYVVPVHTKEMKATYGLGLGLNTMEGREAKHIAIAKNAANTAHKYRWEQVFRHEYISLVWLRAHGYTSNINSLPNTSDSANLLSYIPKRVLNKNPNFCTCGLDKQVADELCRFCSHELRKKIKKSIHEGKANF